MKTRTAVGLAIGAGLIGAGVATGAASLIFLKKTLFRPGETSQDIIDEFADAEKMAGYMEKMAPVSEWMEKQELENIFIRSRDGLSLHAFYLAADKPSKKVALLHHGFTSKAMDNMTQAKILHDLGFEVLLLDLRAHGESEGEYVGFGILDRFDTLEWVRYAKKRFGDDIRIALQGVSMGATTALMALGVPEIQKSAALVIADCGFTSPAEVFANVIRKDYHLPAAPIIGLNGVWSKALAGYKFSDYSTIDALKKNKVPVLFIHGEKDVFVPTWMSRKNYDACTAPKELLIVKNAGHGSSAFEDPKLYRTTIENFVNKYLPGEE